MAETDVDAAENGFAKATQTADQNKTPQNTNYDTIEHKLLLIGIPRADLARKPVRENCTPELLGCGEAHEPPSATPATLGK